MQRLVLAALAATLGFAAPLHAQRPRGVQPPPARFVINGHTTAALGTSVGDEFGSLSTSTGLGAGIEVGYLVTPRLLAYAGVDIAKQGVDLTRYDGNFGLTHLEAGARLSLPIPRSKVLPYLGVWVGRRALSTTVVDLETGQQADLSFSGLSAGASGGAQVFLSPKLALDGGVSLGIGKLGNVKVNGVRQDSGTPDNTTTTRIRLGANWYP